MDAAAPLVFITGASSGIGQALALRHAQAGWRLALVARRLDDMQAWVRAQGLGDASPVADNGSAEGRARNRRVEVVFPVEKPEHVHHLRDNVLAAYLKDNLRARVMNPDGTYSRLSAVDNKDRVDVQDWLRERIYKQTH